MQGMFYANLRESKFNQPIGNWNTTAVINMQYMVLGASAFNQKLCWDRNGKNVFDIFWRAGGSSGNCWGTGTWPGDCT